MIRADRIDKDYSDLDLGDIFTYKTKRRFDEYVVVGINQEYWEGHSYKVPLAVLAFPRHRFTKVHEVRNKEI